MFASNPIVVFNAMLRGQNTFESNAIWFTQLVDNANAFSGNPYFLPDCTSSQATVARSRQWLPSARASDVGVLPCRPR